MKQNCGAFEPKVDNPYYCNRTGECVQHTEFVNYAPGCTGVKCTLSDDPRITEIEEVIPPEVLDAAIRKLADRGEIVLPPKHRIKCAMIDCRSNVHGFCFNEKPGPLYWTPEGCGGFEEF